MKIKKLFAVLTVVSVGFLASCNNDDDPNSTNNPNVIPLQTTVQTDVSLGDASAMAVLAGSAVTSTGATNITGDLGLSPGTSVGGFPPGVLTGTLRIGTTAAQAKLDLTAAYNDVAGRTSTDIVTLSGNLGGLTLTPGLYKSTSSLAISSGDLTI